MLGQVLEFPDQAKAKSKGSAQQYDFFPDSSIQVFTGDSLTRLAVEDGHAKAMQAVLELFRKRHKQPVSISASPKSSNRKIRGALKCAKPLSQSELELLDRTYEVELASQLKKTLNVPLRMTERGLTIPGTEAKEFKPRTFIAKQKPHIVTQQEANYAFSQAVQEVHQQTRGAFTSADLYRAATRYFAEKGIGYRETRTVIANYFRKSKDAVPIFKANSNVQHYYSRTFALAERQRGDRSVRDVIVGSLATLRQTIRDRYGPQSVREAKARTPSRNQQRHQGTHSNVRLKSSSYRDTTNEKLKTQVHQRER